MDLELDQSPPEDLTVDEAKLVGELRSKISHYARKNEKRLALFEGEFVADQIGIAVPPFMKEWPVRIGWGGTIIRTHAGRSKFLDFQAPGADLMGLDTIVAKNRLRSKSDRVMESMLVVGTTFVVIGKDARGQIVIEPKSPSVMAARENYLTGELDAALLQVRNDKGWVLAETLYLTDQTVTIERKDRKLVVTRRNRHGHGEIPVVQFKHQPNDSHPNGRSLITAPIEYTIGNAARTMLEMEVHREFFAAPQRAALGADPEVFGFDDSMSPEEKYALGWSIVMGRMNFVPRDEETGELPRMHEFSQSAPTPYIDIMKYLSLMVASDSGIPASYFGIMTDNPASSDSIKALEGSLEQRSIERARECDWYWLEVARKALVWRDGKVDADAMAKIFVEWGSASTPTPSAAADAGMKLVAAEILPKDSKVTYDRIGLTDVEQKQLEADKRAARVTNLLDGIRGGRDAEAQSSDKQLAANLAAKTSPDTRAELRESA